MSEWRRLITLISQFATVIVEKELNDASHLILKDGDMLRGEKRERKGSKRNVNKC